MSVDPLPVREIRDAVAAQDMRRRCSHLYPGRIREASGVGRGRGGRTRSSALQPNVAVATARMTAGPRGPWQTGDRPPMPPTTSTFRCSPTGARKAEGMMFRFFFSNTGFPTHGIFSCDEQFELPAAQVAPGDRLDGCWYRYAAGLGSGSVGQAVIAAVTQPAATDWPATVRMSNRPRHTPCRATLHWLAPTCQDNRSWSNSVRRLSLRVLLDRCSAI